MSGGGTGGHIIPNIALIQELRDRYPAPQNPEEEGLKILYIGTRSGMERAMMKEHHVLYRAITCGKLRRYFSLWNVIDFFKIPIGVVQAFFQLLWFRPRAIFCKGGYVCFPVAIAGRLLRIPVLLHESDVTPGLANRMSARFASTVCVSYEESKKYFPHKKVAVTGNPVRRELAFGTKENGMRFADFSEDKPVILFMGGSLGAEFINEIVFRNLNRLLLHYQVVHICGAGKMKPAEELLKLLEKKHRKNLSRYRAFNFVGPQMKDLYAAAAVIVSRAGAISLAEIDFFEKPALIIPLSKKVSRGDQITNSEVFSKHHPCSVLLEEEYTDGKFFHEIKRLLELPNGSSGESEVSGTSLASKHHHKNKFAALEKIVSLLETA